MLGVEVGFWEAMMKPQDDPLIPPTPDTPELTQRLGNRIGTLTTPEGDVGKDSLVTNCIVIGNVT